ncbi:LysE family translocator [Vibrio makurazakiensis]|uniref:LysE family translocator n=1 Tax=Vibrio makurazakiensis TaxID=2910250 RepID=UPI003D15109F
MEWQFFFSVTLFAIVMTGTPGPNNVMLTASGANFGYKRSIPHFLGIGLGLVSLIILNGVGLGVLFQTYPMIQQVLKVLGSAYLLYLAWKIASSSLNSNNDTSAAKPMTCFQAMLFQYLNPKSWVMSITAVGSFTYTDESYWISVLTISVIFIVVQIQTSSVWVGFGTLIRRWLSSPKAWQRFNIGMGALTASCVVFIW